MSDSLYVLKKILVLLGFKHFKPEVPMNMSQNLHITQMHSTLVQCSPKCVKSSRCI